MMEYFADRVKDLSGSAIRATFKLLAQPGMISFAGGAPSPDSFPCEELARISEKILREKGRVALQYGITEGYAPLAERVRSRLEGQRIALSEDSVIITSGGQQVISLAAQCLLNSGDVVICENPSFIGALNAFRSFGARLVGVDMAEDGMDMDKLEDALRRNKAKIIYTIPTFQNPMGVTMSLTKRKRLLELAGQYNCIVLEDNPYGELRFGGAPLPTLKELDGDGGRVLYAGSFSKVLSPGLRVGFACGASWLLEKMTVCKQVADVHTSILPQMIVDEFFSENDFDSHVKRLSYMYGAKCARMIACIERSFPENISFTRPQGGLFIWCEAGGGIDSNELFKRSVENKVAIVAGSALLTDPTLPCSGFRLNYSASSDENIEKGIEILGEVLRGYAG